MPTKNENTGLQLHRHGQLSLQQAQETVNYALSEMASGKKFDSQMHTGKDETLYVFIANGICATLHLQAFNPIQEGGVV